MAKIFISHSSTDKEFIRKLKKDLEKFGHEIWLDEHEINIGDSISSEIEEGLSNANLLILVLTPDSVSSNWVGLEWRFALSREIEEDKKIIIPIYLKSCEIPIFLKERLYVDFRIDYPVGFAKLVQKIDNPEIKRSYEVIETLTKENKESEELAQILEGVQDKNISLTKSLTRALSFARKYAYEDLVEFCEKELKGWDKVPENPPKYREFEAFLSVEDIYNVVDGWDSSSSVLSYMENSSRYLKINEFEKNPISFIEKKEETPHDLTKALLTRRTTIDHPETGKTQVYIYAGPISYQNVIEAIRVELTKKLIDL